MTILSNLAEQVEVEFRKNEKWERVSPATLSILYFSYSPVKKNLSEKKIDLINQKKNRCKNDGFRGSSVGYHHPAGAGCFENVFA